LRLSIGVSLLTVFWHAVILTHQAINRYHAPSSTGEGAFLDSAF
jgi:hypothetical protein